MSPTLLQEAFPTMPARARIACSGSLRLAGVTCPLPPPTTVTPSASWPMTAIETLPAAPAVPPSRARAEGRRRGSSGPSFLSSTVERAESSAAVAWCSAVATLSSGVFVFTLSKAPIANSAARMRPAESSSSAIVSAPLASDALSPEVFRYANPGISWSSPARTDCECTPPSAGNRRVQQTAHARA